MPCTVIKGGVPPEFLCLSPFSLLFSQSASVKQNRTREMKLKEVKKEVKEEEEEEELNITHIFMSIQRKHSLPPTLVQSALDNARELRKRKARNWSSRTCEVKSLTLIRGEEVQLSLGTQFPSFVKLMVKSHVAIGFFMRLPVPFCKSHLPTNNANFVLEKESCEQYKVKFIAVHQGFSAGWKKFANVNELLEGDALVFQLTEAHKFKVYIVRGNHFRGPSSHLDVDSDTQPKIAGPNVAGPFSSAAFNIKSIEDFEVIVNSSLPDDIRTKYYDLCSSQKSLLHAHLHQRLACPAIISGTVKVADAIRGCKATTSEDEFGNWEKTLKSLEAAGRNVVFLQARLHSLRRQAFATQAVLVELALASWKEKAEEAESIIEGFKSIAETCRRKFEEEADRPW